MFLASMNPLVMPQRLGLCESLRAETAGEIFDLFVDDFVVPLHVADVVESLPTSRADMLALLLGEVHLRGPRGH